MVRVPVVVREGFSGGTRAAFRSNSKFYASLLLQVSQSTSLFARIYSSVMQMLVIRLCAKVILSTVYLSNYILLKPGGTFQHKKNRCYAITKSWRTTDLGSVYFTATILAATDQLEPLGLFTWRFKWPHQLTFLVTWHDYCWITNCSSDRMSSRKSEHSTLVIAWFVSELPGKSVFAKQPP